MRIDVITLHAVKNYGSVLQAFATKKIFELYGHDVQIINYVKKESRSENLMEFWAGKSAVKRMVMLPTIKRWEKVFGNFCKKELDVNGPVFTYEEDFKNYSLDADMYCTGSDQVWNSKWNNGILPMLYLSFVPEEKFKFAFASSFGQERLSEDEVSRTKEYINQYKYISVREDSAKKIIEEQYHYPKCEYIVDPTLCMDRQFWIQYAKSYTKNGDYILIYNLNRSKAFDDFAKKISKKTGLKLKRLCMRYDQVLRCGKSVIIPEIFEFISLINNAKYVLTDSFHATAFSMNMNTHPLCVYPDEFGGRIENFLKMTDSLQCHVRDYDDLDVTDRNVDFDKVNRILEGERKKVATYLERVFADYERCSKENE